MSRLESNRRWRAENLERLRQTKREYYARNRERIRVRQRAWYAKSDRQRLSARRSEQKQQYKRTVLAHYGPGGRAECSYCGIADVDVLTVDHIENDGAKHRKTDLQAKAIYRWLARRDFPAGYQVLCMNCNYKKYLTRLRQGVAV